MSSQLVCPAGRTFPSHRSLSVPALSDRVPPLPVKLKPWISRPANRLPSPSQTNAGLRQLLQQGFRLF